MNKDYTIAYKGLSAGSHEFDFKIDGALFAAYPESGISSADIDAHVVVTKHSEQMTVDATLIGTVVVPCDRCLEDCTLDVRYNGSVDVKFSEEPLDEDDDTLWQNPQDDLLDLTHYFYESVVLSLPFPRVHPSDIHGNPLCNPAMLSRFKIVSAEEFDRLTQPKGETLGNNPELRKLAHNKE